MNPKDQIPSAEEVLRKHEANMYEVYNGSYIIKAMEEYASLKTKAKDEEIERLKGLIQAGADVYGEDLADLGGQINTLEQSNKELLEALRKIQDFDEYSEYEDPGQIAKEAIERSTNFKKPCPVSLRPAG